MYCCEPVEGSMLFWYFSERVVDLLCLRNMLALLFFQISYHSNLDLEGLSPPQATWFQPVVRRVLADIPLLVENVF
jgi:hypothetical protein